MVVLSTDKAYNLLSNFRMNRTPHRKVVLVDFRSSKNSTIAGFQLWDESMVTGEKMTIFCIPGTTAHPKMPSNVTIATFNFSDFQVKYPFLCFSGDPPSRALAAYPLILQPGIFFCGLFGSGDAAMREALGIDVVVEVDDFSDSVDEVIDSLYEEKVVLVVDKNDGSEAGGVACAAFSIFSDLKVADAVTRAMAFTDRGFNPPAEMFMKIEQVIAGHSKVIPDGVLTKISITLVKIPGSFDLDLIQNKLVAVAPTQEDADKLGELLTSLNFQVSRDDWRRTAALLAWVLQRSPQLKVDARVIEAARAGADHFFHIEPSEVTCMPQLHEHDGLPLSPSDCARALLFSLKLL